MGKAKRHRAGGWSYSAGEWGRCRVRVYERGDRNSLWIDYRDESGKRYRNPIGHTDRERAKAQADEMALRFRDLESREPSRFTLEQLFDNYLESEAARAKSASKVAHDRRAAEMFLRFLGKDFEPRLLSRREWDRFIAARQRGTIAPAKARKGKQVGNRVIEYDLKFLHAALNWAATVSDGRGGALLERNPLKGLPLPAEKNPRRPVLTSEQYAALLQVGDRVSPYMRPLFVLAHETGHRIGSIRQLRWSDVDFDARTVTWRAESDKERRAHVTPLTEEALRALNEHRRALRAFGDGCVFPDPSSTEEPVALDRYRANDWWQKAAKLAALPTMKGLGWHSFRRKWAGEMRHVSPRELADLGGWTTAQTPLTIYVQPSLEAQRAALAQRREYTERVG